jgi:lipopolysaccharide export system protein LptC
MRLPAALLSARDLIVTLGIRLVPLFIMAGLTLVSFWFLQKNTQDEALLPPAKKKHEPDYIFINAKLTVLNLDGDSSKNWPD